MIDFGLEFSAVFFYFREFVLEWRMYFIAAVASWAVIIAVSRLLKNR